MEIYRSKRECELNTFMLADTRISGNRRSILSTLPMYTVSDDLLDRILLRNGADAEQKAAIHRHAESQRKRLEAVLKNNIVEDEIPIVTSDEFKNNPPALELSGAFFKTDISYTEEEYTAHMNETKAFAKQNPNYTLKAGSAHAFQNLRIHIPEV